MDLKKTGAFIKQLRKEKGLTQSELSEKLMVSEKTISKWECGNGFPDTTLMLPLCNELGISANELLSAKKLDTAEYKIEAEKNIVMLGTEKENSDKLLLASEIVLGLFSTVVLLGAVFVASFVNMPIWARTIVIVVGFVLAFVGFHNCIVIETKAGYYECSKCNHKHIPTITQVYWSMHMGRTRYMRCPHCHKKSWQRKKINKD